MRDYKFGGFHEEENGKEIIYVNNKKYIGEWVYGYYEEILNSHFIYSIVMTPNLITSIGNETLDEEEQYYDFDLPDRVVYEVIPETVSQYIGLKDENDQEIYEKDYIEYKTSYIRRLKKGIVTYDSSMCAFEIVKSLNKKDISCGDIFDYEDNKWTCEVIGTIFDEEVEE